MLSICRFMTAQSWDRRSPRSHAPAVPDNLPLVRHLIMNHTTTGPALPESDPYAVIRHRIALAGRRLRQD